MPFLQPNFFKHGGLKKNNVRLYMDSFRISNQYFVFTRDGTFNFFQTQTSNKTTTA